MGIDVNRALKPIIFVLAAIYFVVDAIFVAIAKPLTDWIADRKIFAGARAWIVSLRPYPTLALFAVPLIVLEPAKPAAAYLMATGHMAAGTVTLIVAELLKVILVERLFKISRSKLLSIPAFAWSYRILKQPLDWCQATYAWQSARRWVLIGRYELRHLVLQIRESSARLSAQH